MQVGDVGGEKSVEVGDCTPCGSSVGMARGGKGKAQQQQQGEREEREREFWMKTATNGYKCTLCTDPNGPAQHAWRASPTSNRVALRNVALHPSTYLARASYHCRRDQTTLTNSPKCSAFPHCSSSRQSSAFAYATVPPLCDVIIF